MKHKIRHQPEYDYADLKPLINHLETYSKKAITGDVPAAIYNSRLKTKGFSHWAEYLGLPFCTSNPRAALKQYAKVGIHHGNLPLEIMNYLSAYIQSRVKSESITAAAEGRIFTALTMMLDAFGGCERVLQTPLPVAYSIAISQITWLYVMVGRCISHLLVFD